MAKKKTKATNKNSPDLTAPLGVGPDGTIAAEGGGLYEAIRSELARARSTPAALDVIAELLDSANIAAVNIAGHVTGAEECLGRVALAFLDAESPESPEAFREAAGELLALLRCARSDLATLADVSDA